MYHLLSSLGVTGCKVRDIVNGSSACHVGYSQCVALTNSSTSSGRRRDCLLPIATSAYHRGGAA